MTTATLTNPRVVPSTARDLAVRAGSAVVRHAINAWRYLCTVYALVRLGLLWRAFCANTGLAVQRTRTDEYGHLRVTVHQVPKLDQCRVTPHGWTMRVRLRPGQHLGHYTEAAVPLRHTNARRPSKRSSCPASPATSSCASSVAILSSASPNDPDSSNPAGSPSAPPRPATR
jgi:hypothetical protein